MKVILIDDEKLALNYLEKRLKEIGGLQLIGKFVHPLQGKERILQEEVDLVFLDTNLPGIHGIELAEQIIACKPDVHIVFVSAYHDYAIKAFELNAFDYILKPINVNQLVHTVRTIKERHEQISVQIVAPTDTITLNMFQQIEIYAPQHPLHSFQWRTPKAQELFAYLLQHRGQRVKKSTLIDFIWPEFNQERAYIQLYAAMYHIRNILRSLHNHITITSYSDGYMLQLQNVMIDVEQWEHYFQADPELSEQTITVWEEKMKYYKGNYLQAYEYKWIERERERLRQLWLHNAYRMAEWYLSHDQEDKAIQKYEEICQRHVPAEAARFALMKLFAKHHRTPQVDEQYRQLTVLCEQSNIRPSPHVTEWYDNWRQEQDSFKKLKKSHSL